MAATCQLPLLGPPAIIGLTIAGVVVVETILLLLGWLVVVRTRRPKRSRTKGRRRATDDRARRDEGRRAEEGVIAERSPASGRGSFLQRWIAREGNMVYSPVRAVEEPEERTLVDQAAPSVPKRYLVPPAAQQTTHLYPLAHVPYDHPLVPPPPPPALPPQFSCYSPDLGAVIAAQNASQPSTALLPTLPAPPLTSVSMVPASLIAERPILAPLRIPTSSPTPRG
ncbi:Proline rich protein [Rhodotorula toruloides ATCC 204091]|uniref:Proline rich protein n=1 Tax=Rhodotorula toruloides TaxID=5286 RepID=A0A0K3CLX4_RHOTO|nr:Proline rich protein [Rhodotorula toruloides ATCC 204091]KAK4330016.1 Proline rich protein [Rhodotorula toruloides]PRQ71916.1 proline rich protein [Rhodotorula toruloides]